MNAHDCHNETLELVLGGATDDPRFDDVVQHLSDCPDCQRRLDDLSARPSWWHDTRRFLSDSVDTSIPSGATADVSVTAVLDESPVVALADVTAFLESPRHPEMLGRIGKYEIEREVGRGGMGIVLKGFDSELNRPVAIKLLAPHLASSGIARQRFVREARAAAAVVHENVVAIHGIETDGALPSIVMPYISGVSLQQFVDEKGALDVVDVVRIGIQVSSGLAAAHAQGLVHRDIKPGNIILENEINRIQITDFGLARAAHDANLTRSGIIAGTPSFMSPEQALSESVDHRSDLFSLGSVLYFAATGQLPFRATLPIGVMQQVCSATPKRPREVNSQIPEVLESVIEKLLAKNANERFQNANELMQYLNGYLAHLQQPTSMKAPEKLRTPSSRARRRSAVIRRAKLVLIPLVAALLLAIAMWPAPSASGTGGMGPTSGNTESAVRSPVLTTMSQLDAEIAAIDQELRQLEGDTISVDQAGDSWRDEVGQLDALIQHEASIGARPALEPFVPTETNGQAMQRIHEQLQRLEQTGAQDSNQQF